MFLAPLAICLCAFPLVSEALEERSETLSASVEVAPVFSLSLSNPNLAFHEVSPGKTQVLGEERFFNEVRCQSNNGRPWILKAHLASPLRNVQQPNAFLPPAQLKWKVVEATGSAEPQGRFDFVAFSDQPLLLYTSQGDDNKGKPVILRFQYSLSSPEDALAGTYLGQIQFTMTEGL